MSAPPPKKERGLGTALQTAELLRPYCVFGFLQLANLPVRQCVVSGSRVTNRSLGGFNGGSALSGPLWCYDCADYPQQLLLALGKAAR